MGGIRESKAPAELAPHWFGRSLTLPNNELVWQVDVNVYKDGISVFRVDL